MSKHAPVPTFKEDLRLYRRLLAYVRPYWWMFGVSAIGMALSAVATSWGSSLMKPLVDEGFVAGHRHAMQWVPAMIVAAFFVRNFAAFVGEYAITWLGRQVTAALRRDSFKHMLRLPSGYFDVNGPATIVAKLIFNIEQISAAATTALVSIVQDGLLAIALFGYLVFLNWKLTALLLIVAPVSMLMVRAMSKGFRRKSRQIQESIREISRIANQASAGYRVIKAFGGHAQEFEVFSAAVERNRRQVMRKKVLGAGGMALVQSVSSIGFAFMIYVALNHMTMTAGEFAAYIVALALFTGPLRRLSRVNETIQTGLAAASTTFGLLDQPTEPDDGTQVLSRVSGRIEYRQVSFRYPNSSNDALSDISFVAEPGQTIALVGASGSGKTTLVSMLPRFYRASTGQILIDDRDINTLTLDSLRSNIAIVGQDALLFDDTIARNIAYGALDTFDRARVEAAARAAHVMEFAELLPQGLDTRVGERGALLSGGQRQRIAIARALYRDAPILILDEATSALDTESERLVQDAMRRLAKGRTTLVIAHRLSTIEHADRIVVLAHGRIVESGSHRELLARGGAYAKLHRAQFSGVAV